MAGPRRPELPWVPAVMIGIGINLLAAGVDRAHGQHRDRHRDRPRRVAYAGNAALSRAKLALNSSTISALVCTLRANASIDTKPR